MKKCLARLSLTMLIAVFGVGQQAPTTSSTIAPTVVPRLIRFSGQVKDASGTVGMTFTLHKSQQDQAALWIETQSVKLDAAGRYSVLLGATKAEGIPTELFSSGEAQWLGVRVGGQTEQPRVLLVSVPYALKAAEAETLAGHVATEFVTSDKLNSAVQQQVQQAHFNTALTKKNAVNGVLSSTATNFTDSTTNQVVGVTQNGAGKAIVATAKSNTAVYGNSTATTGSAVGVYGQSASSGGVGLYGLASSTTGNPVALFGSTPATSGIAIAADETAVTGTTTGLQTTVYSPAGVAAIVQNKGGGKIFSGRSGASNVEKFSVDGLGNVTSSGHYLGDGSTLQNVVHLNPGPSGQAINTASTTGLETTMGLLSSFSNGGNPYTGYFAVQQDGGILAQGNFGASTIPYTGQGTLMEWYPGKATFMAGSVDGFQWLDGNVGHYDAIFGQDNTVSADYAVSFGQGNVVSGDASIVSGYGNAVASAVSVVNGNANTVSGGDNLVVGQGATVNGADNAVFGVGQYAIGNDILVSGGNNVAMGNESVAIGGTAGACNGFDFALGYYVTTDPAMQNTTGFAVPPCSEVTTPVGHTGSFIWGDLSPSAAWTSSQHDNEFRVRAQGGIALRTSANANSNLGVSGATGCDLPGGSGTWSCSSSRTIKENFMMLNGKDVLARLRAMPVTTWNYIAEGKDARHLGPVAEDFYTAFGLGSSNTMVGVNDLAGVGLAAAKALDERTQALDAQTQALKQQNALLKKQVSALTARLGRLEKANAASSAK